MLVRPQSEAARAMPRVLRDILSLEDFEAAARRFLPRPIFGYISGGVETDSSLHGNRSAFQELHFLPRILVNTRGRTQKRTLLGRSYDLPFGDRARPLRLSLYMKNLLDKQPRETLVGVDTRLTGREFFAGLTVGF